MACVRNKVFGTPLPEVEELQPQKQECDLG
jgi:hypothetical protein